MRWYPSSGVGGRLDLVVVVDEVGVPLARVAAEEPVEALEAAAERPAVVGARRRTPGCDGIRCHLPTMYVL